jgi:hypothetical protein
MSRFLKSVWRGLLVLVLPLAMAGAAGADEVTDWHEHRDNSAKWRHAARR